ncbi:MAG: hypothetical protein A2498_13135 [Lentisphaerae bacterium RIFOXYC12_FULL_60_16]|nr:MAG: hypothetical protein A2498_13135 [Lentisphaerae bacterium RIFOXYC12_FULL_60_16]OGV82130.1 MAG: hypothetical protein A2340_02375 [Lentisphaerae bacterium RIFOXYB12_FULL_60_10]
MILRLSAKLAHKLRVSPPSVLPLDINPFADWSAHLFTADRIQYILFTNTVCLYSAVMYGKGMTNDGAMISRMVSLLGEIMTDDGFRFHFERFVAPSAACVTLSKALNRAVTGSMSELVYQAQGHLVEGQLSPYDTSFRLNTIPMGQLKYASPKEVFGELKPGDKDASNQPSEVKR